MNAETAAQVIAEDGMIPNIGQFDHQAQLYLNREVRAGRLKKVKGFWPWFFLGTCQKTYYVRSATNPA